MIKKQHVAKTLPILLKYQRYTVHYCIAFITLCIICYIYVQTPTLHMHKKTVEYSSWTFSHFLKSKSFNNSKVQASRYVYLNLLVVFQSLLLKIINFMHCFYDVFRCSKNITISHYFNFSMYWWSQKTHIRTFHQNI